MSRTNILRQLITKKLKTVCENIYYEIADERNMYPHIVYQFKNINHNDQYRNDIEIEIDIYDRSTDAKKIEELADQVEDLFNNQNIPQDTILPTFFLNDRMSVPDEDKKIRHRNIRILCQNYER